ncbi:MAG: hypothetical protein HC820_01455 [Hydrococcus sp. RM1_1_31]|nr:hypothetical protein [Hydrococcus sp. RM1_1_31]
MAHSPFQAAQINSIFGGFMMSNCCLLPNKNQKDFAEYMMNQYGKDYGYRYLAVVTNPLSSGNGKFGGRSKGNRQLPQIKYGQLNHVFDLV